jgi:hypothetical protein
VRSPNALRRICQLTISGVLAVGVTMVPTVAGSRTSSLYRVGTNLHLKTVRDAKGPQQIRVLNLGQSGDTVPDIAPATQQYQMWAMTSAMSARANGIAGVNGDFGTGRGQPKHTLMIDGELWTTGQSSGNAIGWSADGRTAFVGHPRLKIGGHDITTGSDFLIRDWNVGRPTAGSIQGYTRRGGSETKPPGSSNPGAQDPHWCAARLKPAHPIGWNGSRRSSLVRRYRVAAQPEPCEKTPLSLGTISGNVVLAVKANSRRSNKIVGLKVGDTVKINWTIRGWPRVTDVMGAQQMLVNRGNNVAPSYHSGGPYILNYNPRTAAGISRGCSDNKGTTNCRIILITIDGRQGSEGWSKGVRMPYLARELIRAGAWKAVNLDGGGSTTMWVKKRNSRYCESTPGVGGCLANRPSPSTGERRTRSAIIVLPGTDRGTPKQLR